MFGENTFQKAVNGTSFSVLVVMVLGVLLMILASIFGLTDKREYTYEIPYDDLGVKFGYHMSPHIGNYKLPIDDIAKIIVDNGKEDKHFLNSLSAKIEIHYDGKHKLESISATMFHSKQYKEEEIYQVYELFEKSINEFVVKFNPV